MIDPGGVQFGAVCAGMASGGRGFNLGLFVEALSFLSLCLSSAAWQRSLLYSAALSRTSFLQVALLATVSSQAFGSLWQFLMFTLILSLYLFFFVDLLGFVVLGEAGNVGLVLEGRSQACPSEPVLGDGCSDSGNVSHLQDVGAGASIFPGYFEDFPEAPLMMCL